ncbi:MAG: hypothetical protein QOJ00_1121 [Actinomycetota bacterium]|jgi:hypothetical protein
MVELRRLRGVVIAVCVAAIPTMIVGSILDRNGIALFGGLCAATAIGCLLVATTVAPVAKPNSADDEAARVESLINDLARSGADEATLRGLARAAIRLGRAQQGATDSPSSV